MGRLFSRERPPGGSNAQPAEGTTPELLAERLGGLKRAVLEAEAEVNA